MAKQLLQFSNVYYTYPGANEASLNGLNLSIPKGKKTALIGQNGSGKTTLFLLANGLYKPQKGQIFYEEQLYCYQNKFLSQLRQKVGLVFQNPEQQIVGATVEEDISYGLCNLELSKSEIREAIYLALKNFELTELANKPVHHLSLGQKKFVSLADVMVLKPEILLLDEPTAYLDPFHKRKLLEILSNLPCQTQVMATHDLDLVYCWADWVLVLDGGQLILAGSPESVFAQRAIMDKLHLGVPLIYEILEAHAFLGNLNQDQILELRQRILKKLQNQNPDNLTC